MNLFKRPFEKETLDDWAKLAVNLAQYALVALPVVIYSQQLIWFKLLHIVLILCGVYGFLAGARLFRKLREESCN